MTDRDIITKFGGIRSCAFALGHNNPSTVQSWWENDHIPYWRVDEVLRAARKKRLGLKETDFNGGARGTTAR